MADREMTPEEIRDQLTPIQLNSLVSLSERDPARPVPACFTPNATGERLILLGLVDRETMQLTDRGRDVLTIAPASSRPDPRVVTTAQVEQAFIDGKKGKS
jgi:hypothetical protein